jgi:hypothetical protein
MNWMNRWMSAVTASAFLAMGAPSFAHARGADDVVPQLPNTPKTEKPHFAAGAKALLPKPVNPKQQQGQHGIRVAAGAKALLDRTGTRPKSRG